MSSRTRTLLLTGCFLLVGLFAPLPPLWLGASSSRPAPARDSASLVAAGVAGGIAAPAAGQGVLTPAVLGAEGSLWR